MNTKWWSSVCDSEFKIKGLIVVECSLKPMVFSLKFRNLIVNNILLSSMIMVNGLRVLVYIASPWILRSLVRSLCSHFPTFKFVGWMKQLCILVRASRRLSMRSLVMACKFNFYVILSWFLIGVFVGPCFTLFVKKLMAPSISFTTK